MLVIYLHLAQAKLPGRRRLDRGPISIDFNDTPAAISRALLTRRPLRMISGNNNMGQRDRHNRCKSRVDHRRSNYTVSADIFTMKNTWRRSLPVTSS